MKKWITLIILIIGFIVVLGSYVDYTPYKAKFGEYGTVVEIGYKDGRVETVYPKSPVQQMLSLTATYNGNEIEWVKLKILAKTDKSYDRDVTIWPIAGKVYFDYYWYKTGYGYQRQCHYKIYECTSHGSSATLRADGKEHAIFSLVDNIWSHINKPGKWKINICVYSLKFKWSWGFGSEKVYRETSPLSETYTISPIYVTSS